MILQKKIIIQNSLQGYSLPVILTKILFEMIIILILLPIVALVSIYIIYKIKQESKGSILFKQQRIGMNGKPFTCFKFRSMHENSHFNPYTEEDDSRIFPFGKLMRKMRLDELPQLWNVLKGDMHLIGPRAEWDILVTNYETLIPNYSKRHSVRPGITGLAQVSYPYGRNIYDAKQKLQYDLTYIENWSLLLEIKICIQTLLVILGKKGL